MKNIAIFGVSNGVGITRDMNLIRDVLQDDYLIELHNPFRYTANKQYDMCIFLERFSESTLGLSPVNIFIPNQEWFEPGWLPTLRHFAGIFAKTKFAEEIFNKLGCSTEFISFTSYDRQLPEIKKDFSHWLHLAGKSIQKQTELIWQTWQKNPGFPQLTIVQDPKFFKNRPLLRNVNYMYDRLPEDVLQTVQNSFGVHLCTSLTEGFGHYIIEAMSCESMILTTNAAPMNEFINKNNGLLVDPYRQDKMGLCLANHIAIETLEKSVIETMVMDDNEKRAKGKNARIFFEENDRLFKKQLKESVAKYLA